MGYIPQTINPGDLLDPAWGNKVENFLAQFGNYLGVLASKEELPASADVGDWYLVLGSKAICVWDGSKWLKVGGEMAEYRFVDMSEMSVTPHSYAIVGDGATTTFPAPADSVILSADTTYTYTIAEDGSSITFDTAPAAGEVITLEIGRWDEAKLLEINITSEDTRSTIFVGFDAWIDSGTGEARVMIDDVVVGTFVVNTTTDKGFGVEYDKASLQIGNHNITLWLRPITSGTTVYTRVFEARW